MYREFEVKIIEIRVVEINAKENSCTSPNLIRKIFLTILQVYNNLINKAEWYSVFMELAIIFWKQLKVIDGGSLKNLAKNRK